jgi:hypothetical protein
MPQFSNSFFPQKDQIQNDQLIGMNRLWSIAEVKNFKTNTRSYEYLANLCNQLLSTIQVGECKDELIHYRSYWLAQLGNNEMLTNSIKELTQVSPEIAEVAAANVELAVTNPVYWKQLSQIVPPILAEKGRAIECGVRVNLHGNRYQWNPYARGSAVETRDFAGASIPSEQILKIKLRGSF